MQEVQRHCSGIANHNYPRKDYFPWRALNFRERRGRRSEEATTCRTRTARSRGLDNAASPAPLSIFASSRWQEIGIVTKSTDTQAAARRMPRKAEDQAILLSRRPASTPAARKQIAGLRKMELDVTIEVCCVCAEVERSSRLGYCKDCSPPALARKRNTSRSVDLVLSDRPVPHVFPKPIRRTALMVPVHTKRTCGDTLQELSPVERATVGSVSQPMMARRRKTRGISVVAPASQPVRRQTVQPGHHQLHGINRHGQASPTAGTRHSPKKGRLQSVKQESGRSFPPSRRGRWLNLRKATKRKSSAELKC